MSKKSMITVLSVSALLLCVLAVLVCRGDLQPVDSQIANAVQSLENSVLTGIMKVVSVLGDWYVYIPFAVLLLIIPKIRFKIGVPVSIVLAVSAGLNWLMKFLFAIPRPDAHRLIAASGYGFPSGHAMIGTAFVGTCACLFIKHSIKLKAKRAIGALAVIFLIFEGFSRIYLGVHNPTDVIGGYLAGVIICSITLLILQNEKNNQMCYNTCNRIETG